MRFDCYHFQWAYGKFLPEIGYNKFHENEKKRDPGWKWFELYELKFPWRF